MKAIGSVFAAASTAILLVAATPASAAQLAIDGFQYPVGALVGLGGWTNQGGTSGQVQLVAGSLSYTDGNTVSLGTAGNRIACNDAPNTEDIGKDFSPAASGDGTAVYTAILVRNTGDVPTEDYFYSFMTNTTTYRGGRLYGRASGAGYELGLRYGSEATSAYAGTAQVLLANTTYFVVMKHSFVAGTNNDVVSLWINPNLDQGSEPAPYLTLTNPGTVADVTGINRFAVREGTASGGWEFDEIRVGTTWADVTGSAGPPVDNTPPTVASTVPNLSKSVVGSLTKLRVIMSEGVTGVVAGNLTVGGSPATAVTAITASEYEFSGFTTPGVGSHPVVLASGAIQDPAFNPFAGANFTLDVVNPPANGLLVYEPFNYATGVNLQGQGSWTSANPAGGIVVDAASSLSYGTLPVGSGGRIVVTQGGAFDANLLTTTLLGEGKSLYCSMIYLPTGAPGSSYWLHNITEASVQNQLGRIAASTAATPAHKLEARWRGAASNAAEPSSHATGTAIFVVAKSTMVAGADNDKLDLWIDPALGGAEPAPTVSSVVPDTGNDADPAYGFQGIALRVSNTTGDFQLDELRVGTTWEAVTPSVGAVSDWSLYAD
jgi:hypothetical protein